MAKNTENTVTIKIPILPNDSSDVFVSINDRTWLIKRGVEVAVPWNVAEVIRQSEDMTLRASEFVNSRKAAR